MQPLHVFFDRTQPCHLQWFFHWWPLPPPVPIAPSCLSRILLANWWWKPSRTVNIAPVTNQISFPYSNSVWTTDFYIIICARTTAPAFVRRFFTIPLHLQDFLRFCYRAAQLLLLYATVCPRYGKADLGSIWSDLTWIMSLLYSKDCWRVSRRLCCSYQIWHLYKS